MTLEQHQLILDLVAGGESLEAIACRLGRSVEAVKRVAGERRLAEPVRAQVDSRPNQTRPKSEPEYIELDEIVDFLSNLPEEGLKEVCELASLQRRTWHLKNQLRARLNEK